MKKNSKIYKYDVFISYSAIDIERVQPIFNKIISSNIKAFLSETSLKTQIGKNFAPEITKALLDSCHLLIICSDHIKNSWWVEHEYETFLMNAHIPSKKQRLMIPYLLEGESESCIPDLLKQLQRPKNIDEIIFLFGGIDISMIKTENDDLRKQVSEQNIELQNLKRELSALTKSVFKSNQKLITKNKKSREINNAQSKSTNNNEVISINSRNLLQQKRIGFTQTSRIGGQLVYIKTGEYLDGRLGEIFIDMPKESSTFSALLKAFAKSISICLQYSVPLSVLVDEFTFTRFEPSGPVDHPNIKFTTSITDFIFRLLAFHYLHRYDLVHISPDDSDYSDIDNNPNDNNYKPIELPPMRSGFSVEVKINGETIQVRTGEYPNGNLGEIFIDMFKGGSSFRSLLSNFATSISIGLQYGVSLQDLCNEFIGYSFDPSGQTDNLEIPTTTSILDFVFQVLANEYLTKNRNKT